MIPESAPEGRRRMVSWLALGFVVINVLVIVLGALAPEGAVSGPTGSSYVTTPTGTSALAGTLERLGAQVTRSRVEIDSADLQDVRAVVLIDVTAGAYTSNELEALERFVADGGRLIVIGDVGPARRIFADAPTWRSTGAAAAEPTATLPLTSQPGAVPLSGFGSLVTTEADIPLLIADGLIIASYRGVGAGDMVLLADSGPAYNGSIGEAGAAEFLAAVIGASDTVVFDEFRHGYVDDAGLWAAIAPGWQLALILAAVTTALALGSYARRWGPPEEVERRLSPGRGRYLESVGSLLERSGDVGEALDVIRTEARGLLGQRADTELVEIADARGLSDRQVEALLGDDSDSTTLQEADGALAQLVRERP